MSGGMLRVAIYLIIQLVFASSFFILCYVYWTPNNPLAVNLASLSVQDSSSSNFPTNSEESMMLHRLTNLVSKDSKFPESIEHLDQEDRLLHKFVQLRHLTPPSKEPYNLPYGNKQIYGNGYTSTIASLFTNKKNGTFIEAGAYDGVAASNTLFLERVHGWTGLLVECNPLAVPLLKLKKRKAWVADVCLSTSATPKQVNFSSPVSWAPSARIGGSIDLSKWGLSSKTEWTQFQVTTIPVYALMSAISMLEVDFFSLDVEAAELHVLKTIPWEKVKIKVLLVEVELFSSQEREEMKSFMKSKGYKVYKEFNSDWLLVHSSYVM